MLSIVIPAYNEEWSLEKLVEEIREVMDKIGEKYEVIITNDGSKDNTWQIIKDLCKKYSFLKWINFSRNFWHQAAVSAWLNKSIGEAVIMMDWDWQHPPYTIPDLIKKRKEGYEIVNTQRLDNKNTKFFKKFTAWMFYKIINLVSETKIDPGSADFRLLDRKVVNVIKNFDEPNMFYRWLVNWVGFKKISIPYEVRDRFSWNSSYTFKKMLKFATTWLTSFSIFPLRIIWSLGFLIMILSLIWILYVLYQRFILNNIYWFTNLWLFTLINTFFIGMLMIVLWIMAIYLANIHESIKWRPQYIISEEI